VSPSRPFHPQQETTPQDPALTTALRCYLDAFSRRHEARKIYLRQTAAQRWIQWREQVLMGGQPHSEVNLQLSSLDQQLRSVRFPRFATSVSLWHQLTHPGAVHHHRRVRLRRAPHIRYRHGPLDCGGPELAGRPALGAVSPALGGRLCCRLCRCLSTTTLTTNYEP
jgi:hypothetical protein